MAHTRIQPESVYEAKGYSLAIRAGDTIYISGQVPKDRDDNLVGKGDITAQAEQSFRNLEAVTQEAGARLVDIVRYTVYATSLEHKAAIKVVQNRYFGDHRPASTFLVVSSLASPDFLIEVEAVAVIP